MRLFAEDDLARAGQPGPPLRCDACELPRPAAGFIQYELLGMCNACATEYELARARGDARAPAQYVLRRAAALRRA
jgi:hypothetical protein